MRKHMTSCQRTHIKTASVISIMMLLTACNTSTQTSSATASNISSTTDTKSVVAIEAPVKYKILSKSDASAYEPNAKHLQTVINNQADWQTVWDEHTANMNPKPALPVVNFTTENVAAIFSTGDTSCYNLSVSEVIYADEKVEIKYNDEDDSNGTVCPQGIVRPAQFISFNAAGDQVVFTQNAPITRIVINAPVLLPTDDQDDHTQAVAK